jgi:hypothetical protein
MFNLSLRQHFGDNEREIELNPLGAEAPLPLVKGEKIFGRQPDATTGKRETPATYLSGLYSRKGRE